MANLTLSIEDTLLKEARKLAVDRETTVNQMVREFLAQEVRQASGRQEVVERLFAERVPLQQIDWTREDLYER